MTHVRCLECDYTRTVSSHEQGLALFTAHYNESHGGTA